METLLPENICYVSINGDISQSKAAMSGVPQGCVLDHILVLINVNDLPDLLQGDALLFAKKVRLISAGANFDDLHANFNTHGTGLRLGTFL